jgi:plasmid stabilization system protein ParE
MAFAVAFTKEAKKQLQELEAYLADRFYPGNARRYMDRLMESCLALGDAPHC